MARVNSTTKEPNNNFNVANGTGANVRAGINDIFTALRTINSASGDPSGAGNVVQFQPHIDSSTNLLKICTAVSSGVGSFTIIGNITQPNLGLMPQAGGTFTGKVIHNYVTSVRMPSGQTSDRGTSANGDFRYNNETHKFEGYQNGAWGEIGGGAGATGGGTDQVFVETGQDVTEDYQLNAGKNAITVSPTIANNKTITVPNGATLVIL